MAVSVNTPPQAAAEARSPITGLYHHKGILYCAAGPYLYWYDPEASVNKGVWQLMAFRLTPPAKATQP
jgi:hypothetical protein